MEALVGSQVASGRKEVGGERMMVRVRGAWIVLALLTVGLAAAVSLVGFAQPTTYGGVTFPLGDRSFADRVVSYRQASCVRCAFSNPTAILGPPNCGPSRCSACASCDPCALALGFRVSEIDNRGDVVIEFTDNRLTDVPGNDLFVYITNDKACRVEISADGVSYIRIGETKGYPGALDIAPFVQPGQEFRFVRVSDVPADEDKTRCPGPSVDAIGAMGVAEQAEAAEALGSLELLPAGELSLSVGQRASNLLIIFDTSSSMGESFENSTKIDVAKRVLTDVVDQMPNGAIVGLRTFSGCHEQSRLLAPMGPIDRAAMTREIQSMEPGGATAIQYVLEQAKLDLAEIAGAKLILLVSDGSETCQGNPVAAARALIAAGYDLRIDVVGFDVGGDAAARSQLRAIAEATGGVYFSAESTEQLRAALQLAAPVAYHVYDSGGAEVFTGLLGDPGPRLPAGVYRVLIDTTPPVEVPSVTVQSQQTTQITVSRSDGGYTTTVH